MYPTDFLDGRRFFAKGADNAGFAGYWSFFTNGDMDFSIERATAISDVRASVPFTINQWGEIAVCWSDTTGWNIYYRDLNGIFSEVSYSVSSVTGSGARDDESAFPFIVGNRDEADVAFGGLISTFKLYNTKLTLNQCNAQLHAPIHSNLLIHAELGNQGATTISDLSGNGNTGTGTGLVVDDHSPFIVYQATSQTLQFPVPAAAPASAALTGTVTATIDESDIVTGGNTIILTLTGDTWVASGAAFEAQRQAIIDGLNGV